MKYCNFPIVCTVQYNKEFVRYPEECINIAEELTKVILKAENVRSNLKINFSQATLTSHINSSGHIIINSQKAYISFEWKTKNL